MNIDAHCHAWQRWPYSSVEPEPEIADVDRLLAEFDRSGVGHGLLIAAQIGGESPRTDNGANNGYAAAAVRRHPGRLSMCADVDSFWSDDHHTDGARHRLDRIIAETGAVGFTHYSTGRYDGWFDEPAGIAMFERAADLGLIASLHTPPDWQPAIGRLAQKLPTLPILIHHQGHVVVGPEPNSDLHRLLDNAVYPNIRVKVSGFYYLTGDNFPYPAARTQLVRIHREYGAGRLLWGSDWPVASQFLNYPQTVELVAEHCPFLDDRDRKLIMGDNLAVLLGLDTA